MKTVTCIVLPAPRRPGACETRTDAAVGARSRPCTAPSNGLQRVTP